MGIPNDHRDKDADAVAGAGAPEARVVCPGNWIITFPDGSYLNLFDSVFQRLLTPLTDLDPIPPGVSHEQA